MRWNISSIHIPVVEFAKLELTQSTCIRYNFEVVILQVVNTKTGPTNTSPRIS